MRGDATAGPGGYLQTSDASQHGVNAVQAGPSTGTGAAVRADGRNNYGVLATAQGARPALNAVNLGYGAGVVGVSRLGVGVSAISIYGDAIRAISMGNRHAIYAQGYGLPAVWVEGNLHVNGAIQKLDCQFLVDHPLDPENKYLGHASLESAERLNVYSGNVVTNAKGLATVRLPNWFEAINRDYRYQLTAVGGLAQVAVLREIAKGRFTIQSDRPRMKVSWQVTAVRNDAWSRSHPMRAERTKPKAERGTFLHPKELGKAADKGVRFATSQELSKAAREAQRR